MEKVSGVGNNRLTGWTNDGRHWCAVCAYMDNERMMVKKIENDPDDGAEWRLKTSTFIHKDGEAIAD